MSAPDVRGVLRGLRRCVSEELDAGCDCPECNEKRPALAAADALLLSLAQPTPPDETGRASGDDTLPLVPTLNALMAAMRGETWRTDNAQFADVLHLVATTAADLRDAESALAAEREARERAEARVAELKGEMVQARRDFVMVVNERDRYAGRARAFEERLSGFAAATAPVKP